MFDHSIATGRAVLSVGSRVQNSRNCLRSLVEGVRTFAPLTGSPKQRRMNSQGSPKLPWTLFELKVRINICISCFSRLTSIRHHALPLFSSPSYFYSVENCSRTSQKSAIGIRCDLPKARAHVPERPRNGLFKLMLVDPFFFRRRDTEASARSPR